MTDLDYDDINNSAGGSSHISTNLQESCPTDSRLVPLRTRAEVAAREEKLDVYVCEVPVKKTAPVLSAIRTIPGQHEYYLGHLRRVAKDGYLPEALKRIRARENRESQTPSSYPATDIPSLALTNDQHIYVLLAPAPLTTKLQLQHLFQHVLPEPPQIHTLQVPLHPPSTEAQAARFSASLWPTVHNPNTAYGPNPTIVARSTQRLQPGAARWIALARQLGDEAKGKGYGTGVGAVVVSCANIAGHDAKTLPVGRAAPEEEKLVCGAGDASYLFSPPSTLPDASDAVHPRRPHNPAAHPLLRAVGMVARKRLALLQASSTDTAGRSIFHDAPLTPLERRLYDADPAALSTGGYLCNGLRFYVSDEPCVGCGMACVHSRVAGLVFAPRGRGEGGACGRRGMPGGFRVEGDGEGYGMHWREELNWRFLCWEFVDGDAEAASDGAAA